MLDCWEIVLSVHDLYDQPRSGLANLNGRPHVYECQFDTNEDEYSDQYWVREAEPDLVALEQERWQIWLRYARAFRAGDATRELWPALPAERNRYDELTRLIGTRLHAGPNNATFRRAIWRRVDEDTWEVCWQRE